MITIDARWINVSGIGTYLAHIIPGIILNFNNQEICLLGPSEELKNKFGKLIDSCHIVNSTAKMYTLREQVDYLRLIPKETKLYFSTHYNVPLFYSGKMVVIVYDVMHLAMPHYAPGIHKQFYAKFMFNALRKKADAIITISNFTKIEMERLLGKFKQQIHPIYLGVGKEWFTIPTDSSPHQFPYILYVGNIKPHKNLKTLVKAFAKISSFISHDLILVGKKDGFITGDKEIADLSKTLPGRIHFTGIVSDNILHQYFRHADAFIFPSQYEGFGLPPLEAMAVGCPVVSSNAASLPEICGDAALFFNPYDVDELARKLKLVLYEENLRQSLKKLGFDQAAKFTWDSCIHKTTDVIEKIMLENDT